MTPEQVAALSDMELALEMAKIAGLDCNDVNQFITLFNGSGPDYLHDLNAISQLCKMKKYKWQIGYSHLDDSPILIHLWKTLDIMETIECKDEKKLARSWCEAVLLLAEQERKK